MSARLTPLPVPPLGYRDTPAFVDGSNLRGLRRISTPIFPPSEKGNKLREARHQQSLNFRDAARMFGIRVSELSKLEMGEYTLSPEDWDKAFALLGITTTTPSRTRHKPGVRSRLGPRKR